jgi:EAL domain-containing protein (putative c-di-GMP-specific phosphodiesterase class I)
MSRAKANGRRQYVFFEEKMTAQVLSRNSMERELRQALANNEIQVYYQPQVDLRSGKINAAEALVRWKHPKRGFVRPDEFIAIAEKSDLIAELDQYVRQTACTQYRVWEAAGIAPDRLSVNVSSREIKKKDFVEQIETVLRVTGMRPFCLELEITESLLVDHSVKVLDALKCLNEKGVRIAIDDFGTGYSSMAYLKRLPFDILKVDRAFVKDIGTADGSEAIISAILGMAHSLGKEVVAEGVETEAQRVFLALKGCEVGQGFLWSKAVPAEEFADLQRAWVAKPQQRVLSGVRAARVLR